MVKSLAAGMLVLLLCCAVQVFAQVEKSVFRATVGDDGVQRVDLVGGENYFEPNHIIVRLNLPVVLKVRKEGGILTRDMIVISAKEAGIDISRALGSDPVEIRFTPTKVGTFPIYCDKKVLFLINQRDKGHAGILQVVE